MTTSADRIEEIFQDARHLQDDALEMLTQGRIATRPRRSWGATKRRHRRPHPGPDRRGLERTPDTGAGLRVLESLDPRIRSAHLRRRHHVRQAELHGRGFYNGLCDPLEDTDRLVRRTSVYIDDAQRMAVG